MPKFLSNPADRFYVTFLKYLPASFQRFLVISLSKQTEERKKKKLFKQSDKKAWECEFTILQAWHVNQHQFINLIAAWYNSLKVLTRSDYEVQINKKAKWCKTFLCLLPHLLVTCHPLPVCLTHMHTGLDSELELILVKGQTSWDSSDQHVLCRHLHPDPSTKLCLVSTERPRDRYAVIHLNAFRQRWGKTRYSKIHTCNLLQLRLLFVFPSSPLFSRILCSLTLNFSKVIFLHALCHKTS